MRFKLAQKWTDYLLHAPESGMGYQRVDVHFEDGSVERDCVVFNAEDIELPDTCKAKAITDIRVRTEDHRTKP